MSGDSLGSPLSMGTEGWEPVVRAMKWREVRKKNSKTGGGHVVVGGEGVIRKERWDLGTWQLNH